MRYFIVFISILLCSYTGHSQHRLSKIKEWLFPPAKEVKAIHPKLDTAQVLLIDSSETFFSRHYSPDIDDSGLDLVISDEEATGDEESDDEEEAEELFYLDSLEAEYHAAHIKLQNENEWVMIDPYFHIFDSTRVNPYRFDPSKISDTISFTMHSGGRKWSMPLDSMHRMTSKFGPRGNSYHYGTDIGLDIGDSIRSVFDGVVRISKYNPGGYGNYVLVRHYNGTETLYGHMSLRLVKVGQEVRAGELIGLGGNTGRSSGPHLHFEVRYRGIALNPQIFFNFDERHLVSQVVKLSPSHFKRTSSAVKGKVYHKVKRGETLYGISKKYNVKPSMICKLNKISTKSVLKVGQTLRIR